MPSTLRRPVVLSYFSQNEKKEYLQFLEAEYDSITKAWEQYQSQAGAARYFEVFFPARGSADGVKVAEDIRDYKTRIILFHFSGHAGSRQLLFKDGGAQATGLAGLLGAAPNLKLVVLNGCATHDQVKLLFENNIKIVVATKGKVRDGIARNFADTFYRALSDRAFTIRGAFEHALNELKRKYTSLEDVSTKPIIWRELDTGSEDDRDRWELHVTEEGEGLIDNPNWWQIGDLPSAFTTPATLLSPKGVNDPNVFIGREDELESIRKRLVKGGKLMLINAEGGIGKTTLAARYWNESLYEYKYNAWLFCEKGIVNALKELAPELNVDLTGLDEAKQLAALQHALKKVHDDFLLVLDNANDADDIRLFRREFAGFHWHVLITSRCQGVLEKEQELPITHLPPPLAKELFTKYYQENSPDFDALLDRLLHAISYHTLLVELFAKNLKEASGLITLAYFLQKLETGGLYLDEDSFDVETRYTDYVRKKAATTNDILDILYDFSPLSLPEDQRFLLVNLSLLPAENYELLFLIDLLAPKDKRALHATVKNLYQKGWLSGADMTYRLSPVVQGLVLKKNAETLPTDAEALLQNLEEKLKNDGANFTNISFTQAAPFARLVGTLTQHLLRAPTSELALLNVNAGIYFKNTGDIVQAKQAFEKHGEISAAIGDVENVAISYSNLGGIYEATGEWKNALENYQEDFRITKEIYQSSPENLSYKNGLAISYGKLGGIYEATGNFKKALENYQEYNRISLEIYQSSPENLSYKNNLAISYEKIGGIYEATGEWKNALENYQERNRIGIEIYQSSPENLSYKNGLAISYSKLGGIYEATGDWKNALENYQEFNRLFKEIYQSSPENLSYKNGLGVSYEKIGTTLRKQGDIHLALKNLIISQKIFRELWVTSQGEIVFYATNFAETTLDLTETLKELIIKGDYSGHYEYLKPEEVKAMRREGHTALVLLADAGKLNEEQLTFFNKLADETWYDF